MVYFEIKAEAVTDCVTIWPNEMSRLPRRQFRRRRRVLRAPGFADEPFEGKAKWPFRPLEYGIESMSGICNCVSSWSGRPTVRFKANPLNSASAIPKANPPPASPRAILFRILVSSIGGEGRWTALMLGILEGSKASSTRAFSSDAAKYL